MSVEAKTATPEIADECLEEGAFRLLREGNTEAWNAIIASNHHRIYKYLLALSNSPNDADDLTQITFVKALNSYETVPLNQDHFFYWLLKIARISFYNLCRKRGRTREILDPEAIVLAVAPTEEIDSTARNKKEALMKVLPGMTEKCRQFFHWYFVLNRAERKHALSTLGIKRNTMDARRKPCIRRLTEQMRRIMGTLDE